MKKITIIVLLISLCNNGWTDIGPNPITLKSIMTNKPCEIQMVSETVNIDLYPDSSFVSCTFNLVNRGDSITLPIGFPVMNFSHWDMNQYQKSDKEKFEIYVDDLKLNKDDIQVPEEMLTTYNKYIESNKISDQFKRSYDSINIKYGVIIKPRKTIITKGTYTEYERAMTKLNNWRSTKPDNSFKLYLEFDSLINKGSYPWYIWDVKFKKGEYKTIKVNYMVPSGVGYGGQYRFIKYLLSTGTGWKDKINKAEIKINLINVQINTLETINPSNYKLDNKGKTISWTFIDIEPTIDNDIYVRYYNPSERKKWENFKNGRMR